MALPAADVTSLKASFSEQGWGADWEYRQLTSGVWGSWTAVEVMEVDHRKEEAVDRESGGVLHIMDIVDLQPLAAVTLRMGDQLRRDGTTVVYVVRAIRGNDLPTWTAVHTTKAGASQDDDGFVAEGYADA